MRRFVLILASVSALHAQKFLADDPIQNWPRPVNVESIKARRINEYYDFFQNSLFPPGELQSKTGSIIPAGAVNSLGEVPDNEWYTNRHYRRRMTLSALMRGPGDGTPPSTRVQWRVVSAKNEGITPGFTIVDGEGRRYLLKFDPSSNPEMASAADVITSKFLFALGYNVPENYIVHFRPEQLKIDAQTRFTDAYGKRRPMTERDVHEMLTKVPNNYGEYRAMASRFIEGTPVGPFRYHGTRSDDPNDTVPHEHRRDLRGLRVFAAWLGHDDSKALNTLDTLVKENGVTYLKHYLIDFGATLGSASIAANSPRSGNDHLFQWKPAARQFLSLGLLVPRWARAGFPDIPAVGAFEYELFDPETWLTEYPNSAFSNMNPDDAFWAARQVMNFTDEEIRAIVRTGEYSTPRAEDWVVRCLIERRDKIGRTYFSRVLPLDGFTIRHGKLDFTDLAAYHFGAEEPYSVQWFAFDNRTRTREVIEGADTFEVPVTQSKYLTASIQSERSAKGVVVYVRNGREVIGREIFDGSSSHMLSRKR
jgi:hypothetical protein